MAADGELTEKDRASEAYEEADRDYLEAVARQAPRDELARAADTAYRAAHRWYEAAYEYLWAVKDAGDMGANVYTNAYLETEQTELLVGLWYDLAMAYRGKLPPVPSSEVPEEFKEMNRESVKRSKPASQT
jgi:hypothetical protein